MSDTATTTLPVIDIPHRWNGDVLFSLQIGSLRLAVEAAVKTGADLRGADLRGANLRGADLRGADLRGADLRGANLRVADLTDANLRGTDLTGANLTDANLRGADLTGTDLLPIRDDVWAVLAASPSEVGGLRQAILDGRIDGSAYSGDCACFIGTLAKIRGCTIDDLPFIKPNPSRHSERWFFNIRPGDTPETSSIAAITLEWVDTFLANMRAAFASQEGA